LPDSCVDSKGYDRCYSGRILLHCRILGLLHAHVLFSCLDLLSSPRPGNKKNISIRGQLPPCSLTLLIDSCNHAGKLALQPPCFSTHMFLATSCDKHDTYKLSVFLCHPRNLEQNLADKMFATECLALVTRLVRTCAHVLRK
jgi:hypothetical protein